MRGRSSSVLGFSFSVQNAAITRALLGLLALAGGAALAQQPAEPVDITPLNGETYYLINQGTGFQADLNGASVTAGTAASVTTRSFTSLTQRWALTTVSAGVWKISNLASGLCLDVAASGSVTSTVDNVCAATASQQWTLAATSSGYYTLTNVGSGLLLDTASNAAGALLVQTALSTVATQSQQWLLRPVFFRGIDNALLEKQEANKVKNGVPWWTDAQQTGDLLAMLKSHGVNMVRIRPTTEPPYNLYTGTTCSGNGCYAETDAQDIDLAKRAKQLGMSVELSLLFDGGSSASIPASWASYTVAQTASATYTYVKAEVEAFRQAGAMPDMIAIGNEVDTGLMGSLASPRTSFSNFATVEIQAMQAVADASSDTTIGPALPMPIRCIHITPSYNLSSFFATANSDSIPYDAMCQSYYPIYHGPLTAAQAAASNPSNKPIEQSVLNAAATALGKPVFLIEVGEHYESGFDANDTWYPATLNGQRQFLIDTESVLKAMPSNLGMGFDYWDATGVNIFVSGGGYSNADGKPDAIYQWNGLTIFDNADTQGYANSALANYSATLPALEALGGKLDPALNYKLVNKATGQILETTLALTGANTALDTATDTGVISQHQQWTVNSNGDGYFQIVNGNTTSGANVLDADQGTSTGSAVVQNAAAATTAATQEWNILTAGGGYFAIVNHSSGLVLAATSTGVQQTAASSVATDWVIGASSNQLWQIVPVHISALSTASRLAFATAIPAALTTGGTLGTIGVNVTNSAGATIGTPAAAITLTLSGPQTASQTATSSAGAASFNLSSLTLNQAGSYTLTASASGLTSVVATFVVALPALTVTASNQASVYGAALPTLTYTVTGYLNGDGASSITGTPALSTTASASSPVATYPIAVALGTLQSAKYSFSFVAGTLTVSQAGSTTALIAPASFVTLGHSFTFSATTLSTTSGTPTGSVILYNGGSQLGSATLSGGVTSLATTALTTGMDTVTAQYFGDTNFLGSSSNSVTVRVSPQNVWVANGGGSLSELSNAGAALTSGGGIAGGGAGLAIDNAGYVWSPSATANTLSRFNSAAAAAGVYSGGGLSGATAIVVDGSGSLWIANSNNTLSLFSNSGSAVSPAAGYTVQGLSAPTAVAIDTSGGLWVANGGNATITRVLGAADPVITPLATAVQNAVTGVKP